MRNNLFSISALTLGVLLSSFSRINTKHNATIYFLYSPTSFTEANFETAANWSKTSSPTSIWCTGTLNPCIVQIEENDVPHIGMNAPEQDFVAKLATITTSTPYSGYISALTYC